MRAKKLQAKLSQRGRHHQPRPTRLRPPRHRVVHTPRRPVRPHHGGARGSAARRPLLQPGPAGGGRGARSAAGTRRLGSDARNKLLVRRCGGRHGARLRPSAHGIGRGQDFVGAGPKGWRDFALSELENALTTYLIGDINKKGASRKDGRARPVRLVQHHRRRQRPSQARSSLCSAVRRQARTHSGHDVREALRQDGPKRRLGRPVPERQRDRHPARDRRDVDRVRDLSPLQQRQADGPPPLQLRRVRLAGHGRAV